MAACCRRQFNADFALAVGPFPRLDANAVDATSGKMPSVHIALATADDVRTTRIPFNLNPALRQIYCAKHALNLTRLAM
jgi:hypothetical protein